MHIEFDPTQVDWIAYIQPSSDDLYQFGGGAYTAFSGVPYQRGAGIGAIFRSLLRYLIPIGKQAGSAIGRQGLESGVRVLSDVLDGRNVRESLVDEGRSGLKSLLDKASLNLSKKAEAVSGNQSGGSSAFDFRRYKKQLSNAATGTVNSFKVENAASDRTTMGPFTTMIPKTINRRLGKRKLQLHSSIGPPLLPSTTTTTTAVNTTSNKRLRKSNSKKSQQRRGRNIRIDSLGTY